MSNQIISFPLTESTFNCFLMAFYSSSLAQSVFHLISCKMSFYHGFGTPWVFLTVKEGSQFQVGQAFFYLGQRSILFNNW